MFKILIGAAVMCMVTSISGAAEIPQLFAGTAKVDISPDQTVIGAQPHESFRLPDVIPPGPKTPPDNIHDRLYARVVILKNKDVSLAIVTTDLIVFASPKVAEEAKKKWGLDYVIQSSTHNHQGMMPRDFSPMDRGQWWSFAKEDPCVSLDWPGFSSDPWYAATEDKIIAAIGEASQNLFPASISAGKGTYQSVYLGHNRRLVDKNGRVRMMWDNPNRLPNGPQDPTVGAIRIDDEAGKPRAFLFHYGCHLCTTMGGPMITRDFAGTAEDYIEKQLGDSCMAMYLQGAEGDIDGYEFKLRGDYGFNVIKQAGESLAKAALRVAEKFPEAPKDKNTSLQIEEKMVNIPYRTGNKSSDICVATIFIGDNLAFVTVPGEIFVQHQLNLTAKSPVANTFIMGIAYAGRGSPYIIYVPTVQAAKEGGYGGEECSYVAGDAGDRIINAALASINELVAQDTTP